MVCEKYWWCTNALYLSFYPESERGYYEDIHHLYKAFEQLLGNQIPSFRCAINSVLYCIPKKGQVHLDAAFRCCIFFHMPHDLLVGSA